MAVKSVGYVITAKDNFTGVMTGVLQMLDKQKYAINNQAAATRALTREFKDLVKIQNESLTLHQQSAMGTKYSSMGFGFLADSINKSNNQLVRYISNLTAGFSNETVSKIAAVGGAFGAASMAVGILSGKLDLVAEKMKKLSSEFQLESTVLGFNLQGDPAMMAKMTKTALHEGGLYGPVDMVKAQTALVAAGLQGYVEVLDKFGDKVNRGVAEMALKPTLELATMTRGLMSIEQTAEVIASIYQKTAMSMGDAIWHEGEMITGLSRFNDMVAKAAINFSFRPEQIKTLLNSMRSTMMSINMAPETALALSGMMMSLGYTPAESGQRLSMISSAFAKAEGKMLLSDMYANIAAQRGAGKETRSGMSSTLGMRTTYWWKEVFGSADEFHKFMSGGSTGTVNAIDFFEKIFQHFAKIGMNDPNQQKGFIRNLLGNTELSQAIQGLVKYKTTLDADILRVDEWGRWLTKEGKLTYDKSQAEILYRAKDASGKSIEYRGLAAARIQERSMQDSRGLSKKFTEQLELTWWGIQKTFDAAKESFMIMLGNEVLPIMSKVLLAATKLFQAFNMFLEEHPMLRKIMGYGFAGITVIFSALAVLAGIAGLFAFAAFIYKSGFVAFKEGLTMFRDKGLAGLAAKGGLAGAAAGVASKGGSLIGGLSASAWQSYALTGNKIALSMNLTKSYLGGIVTAIGKIIFGVSKLAGTFIVGQLVFSAIMKILDGLSLALTKTDKTVNSSMSAIDRFANFFKKLSAVLNFLTKSFYGQGVSTSEIAAMGDFGLAANDFKNSVAFRAVSGFMFNMRELDEEIAKFLSTDLGISKTKVQMDRLLGGGIGALVFKGVFGKSMIGAIAGLILGSIAGSSSADIGNAVSGITGSTTLGYASSVILFAAGYALVKHLMASVAAYFTASVATLIASKAVAASMPILVPVGTSLGAALGVATIGLFVALITLILLPAFIADWERGVFGILGEMMNKRGVFEVLGWQLAQGFLNVFNWILNALFWDPLGYVGKKVGDWTGFRGIQNFADSNRANFNVSDSMDQEYASLARDRQARITLSNAGVSTKTDSSGATYVVNLYGDVLDPDKVQKEVMDAVKILEAERKARGSLASLNTGQIPVMGVPE